MMNYSWWLIHTPPILIYELSAITPPEIGYLLLTDGTPILLTDNEYLILA